MPAHALCIENTDFSRGTAHHGQPSSMAGGSSRHRLCSLQIPNSSLTFLTILHLPFLICQTATATPFPFPLQRFTVSLDELTKDRQ